MTWRGRGERADAPAVETLPRWSGRSGAPFGSGPSAGDTGITADVNGIVDLQALLASISPELMPGSYVFVTVGAWGEAAVLAPIGVFALSYVVGARAGTSAIGTLLH